MIKNSGEHDFNKKFGFWLPWNLDQKLGRRMVCVCVFFLERKKENEWNKIFWGFLYGEGKGRPAMHGVPGFRPAIRVSSRIDYLVPVSFPELT